MSSNVPRVSWGHDEDWSARGYLDRFYVAESKSTSKDADFFNILVQRSTECLDSISGKRFVDIGSGPSITRAIPASRNFDEVVLSDYNKNSLVELRKWINREPDAFDWTSMLQYCAKLEPNTTAESLEERVRSKLKNVVHCDVMAHDIFGKEQLGEFDAAMATLVLECAGANMDEYTQGLLNVKRILKPGGHFIIGATIGMSIAIFNGKVLDHTKLNLPDVIKAVQDTGFEIIKVFYQHIERRKPQFQDELDGVAVILAQKKE